MEKPHFYIHYSNDIFEIFDGSYTPHFDENFRITLIDFYFTDKNIKGDVTKLKSGDKISIENEQFVVIDSIIDDIGKLDVDLEHIPTEESFNCFSLIVKLSKPFITGSDLTEHKTLLKRKRILNKITKV